MLGLLARLAALEMLEVLDPLDHSRSSRSIQAFRGAGRLGAWGFRGALFPLRCRDAHSVTPAVQEA